MLQDIFIADYYSLYYDGKLKHVGHRMDLLLTGRVHLEGVRLYALYTNSIVIEIIKDQKIEINLSDILDIK